ncbi:MAG: carbohydrate binding domain-containing protein [Deltaproteobacteria bacterium]|nr:carbohydrate binding domain-containing protein [Deltaproteobacteria bacterium]
MRRTLALVVTLLAALVTPRVQAQTLLYSEDWESGTDRWRAVGSDPIVVRSDMDVCSSRYVRETILTGGGRIIARTPTAVRSGTRYCLGAWVRGSAGTQPFMGFYLADAAGTTSGTHYWFIGHMGYGVGFPGGPSVVSPVTADGVWRWITAEFTMTDGISHIVPMLELFSAGSAGSADFDNVSIYEGGCPTAPPGGPHAACAGGTPVCTAAGACVQCAASSDCAGATPVCDAAGGVCVGCLADAQCRAPTARCLPSRRQCVGCLTHADCGGATPRCDAATNRCAGCTTAEGCGGAAPLCLPSGACGVCTAADRSRCVGATPVCDTAAGACVRCRADSDCGGATSGRVCDAATGACAAGCVRAPGRNGCPDGTFCTSEDTARVGACTTGCGLDADCMRAMPERPRCLGGDGGMNTCVGCRSDADCGGRMDGRVLCDPARQACVACTEATRGARCTAEGPGAACLMTGDCGCAVDSDCGGARSGRVCVAAMQRCAPGCRSSGGNGCPEGMRCAVPAGAPQGACEPEPVDAGSDAAVDTAADSTPADTAPAADSAADASAMDVPQDLVADTRPDQAPPPDPTTSPDTTLPDTTAPDTRAPTDTAPVDTGAPTTGGDTGGCGCRAPGRNPGALAWALALAALALARRRRSPRRG